MWEVIHIHTNGVSGLLIDFYVSHIRFISGKTKQWKGIILWVLLNWYLVSSAEIFVLTSKQKSAPEK